MVRLRLVLLAMVLAALATPALADFATWAEDRMYAPPGVTINKLDAEDRALVGSARYLDTLRKKFVEVEVSSGRSPCGKFAVTARSQFFAVDANGRFYQPPPAPLKISIPMWFEEWTVQSCGKPGIRSMLVMRDPSGAMKMIEMIPGDTHTDPALQVDTIRIGAGAFVEPGCREKSAFLDSRIVDGARFKQHSWSEEWTLRRCGEVVTRIVQYSEGAKGVGTTVQVIDDVAAKDREGSRITK